jgi:hypothetical protein
LGHSAGKVEQLVSGERLCHRFRILPKSRRREGTIWRLPGQSFLTIFEFLGTQLFVNRRKYNQKIQPVYLSLGKSDNDLANYRENYQVKITPAVSNPDRGYDDLHGHLEKCEVDSVKV